MKAARGFLDASAAIQPRVSVGSGLRYQDVGAAEAAVEGALDGPAASTAGGQGWLFLNNQWVTAGFLKSQNSSLSFG